MTIIIALNHPQQKDFLEQVIRAYTRNGMEPEELALASDTFAAVRNARELPPIPEPDSFHLGDAQVTEISPTGIAVEVSPRSGKHGPIV